MQSLYSVFKVWWVDMMKARNGKVLPAEISTLKVEKRSKNNNNGNDSTFLTEISTFRSFLCNTTKDNQVASYEEASKGGKHKKMLRYLQ